MTSPEKDLPMHYESVLGHITAGWLSPESKSLGIQVVKFANKPEPAVDTLATLGLSRHPVNLNPAEPRAVRQELLFSADRQSDPETIAKYLLYLAERIVDRRSALLRGEVIDSSSIIFPGTEISAVYATNPSPFDASLTEFHSEPPTIFVYLIPITSMEAVLVRDRGWRWFERELELDLSPDFWTALSWKILIYDPWAGRRDFP